MSSRRLLLRDASDERETLYRLPQSFPLKRRTGELIDGAVAKGELPSRIILSNRFCRQMRSAGDAGCENGGAFRERGGGSERRVHQNLLDTPIIDNQTVIMLTDTASRSGPSRARFNARGGIFECGPVSLSRWDVPVLSRGRRRGVPARCRSRGRRSFRRHAHEMCNWPAEMS